VWGPAAGPKGFSRAAPNSFKSLGLAFLKNLLFETPKIEPSFAWAHSVTHHWPPKNFISRSFSILVEIGKLPKIETVYGS
jgi:hypothetical protein